MMDLRSSSLVLKPRQFQEMKEVMNVPHSLLPSGAKCRRARLNIHEIFIVFEQSPVNVSSSILRWKSLDNFLGILVKWGFRSR
ncbi:hypothetical protein TNCV_3211101 [Trichonephila clavipes]|uniref:Uncharacterized protein n=1 Tax=Trichonephila clavipes TaxID=2585209 RepID=A0A8X6V3M9_TRICX|nr:hypothetical protein TNCV_3211101 [Trichonephila clavipes]